MSIATTLRTEKSKPDLPREKPQPDLLTKTILSKLGNPERSSDIDLHAATNQVLKDVGMSTTDSGGKVTFYGRDPIIPSPHRFGSMAAIGLAAKAVAVAALWQLRTGEGQDIAMDVRKALRRFCGFFDGKWETINGRPPIMLDATNPFFHLPLFRETRDGRYVVALNFYPKLCARALNFLRCSPSVESLQNAILQWRADDLENAAAEEGLVFGKVRTFDEFQKERQYTEVLSRMPLIAVEKIGNSEPIPFKKNGKSPLDGIRAFGMGHVIAGAGMGRDLACYGADVLNIWRPDDTEIEAFVWDVQVGMRSTILDYSKEDRAKFERLLKDADVFFANKRPGYLERNGLDAEERPGGPVADSRLLQNGACAARLEQTGVARAVRALRVAEAIIPMSMNEVIHECNVGRNSASRGNCRGASARAQARRYHRRRLCWDRGGARAAARRCRGRTDRPPQPPHISAAALSGGDRGPLPRRNRGADPSARG